MVPGVCPQIKIMLEKFEQKMVTINKGNEGNPRHSNSPKPYLGQMARNPIVRCQNKNKFPKRNWKMQKPNNSEKFRKFRKFQKISENLENFRKFQKISEIFRKFRKFQKIRKNIVQHSSGTGPGQVRDRSGTDRSGQVRDKSGTGPGQVRDKSEIFCHFLKISEIFRKFSDFSKNFWKFLKIFEIFWIFRFLHFRLRFWNLLILAPRNGVPGRLAKIWFLEATQTCVEQTRVQDSIRLLIFSVVNRCFMRLDNLHLN